MKLLIVCQYYYPEPFRVTDLCEKLVEMGHDVNVITGLPNYPMGSLLPEYKKGKRRDEVINGVNVHRCFTIGRRKGVFFRVLNYYSFSLSSSFYASKLKEDYDVVFVYQLSPIMMANAAVRYKKKHGKKLVLYCLDLWPESLVAGGIRRGTPIYKYYFRKSKKIYEQSDRILTTSEKFGDYLQDVFVLSENKINYLPQYAESFYSPKVCHKERDDYIDLLFAGNIGAVQSIETIIKAADILRDNPQIRWHIVGDGSDYEKCKALADRLNLSNVIFYGRKQPKEMPQVYKKADAMLITMSKAPLLSLTLPAKVQSYMAAGKPVLCAADGEIVTIVEKAQCGFCVPAEDAQGLARIAKEFAESADHSKLGQNARLYYEEFFLKERFFEQLEQILMEESM